MGVAEATDETVHSCHAYHSKIAVKKRSIDAGSLL